MSPDRRLLPALLCAAALALPFAAACRRADANSEQTDAIAAVRLDDMTFRHADDDPAPFRTADLRGAPYWILVFRANDEACLAALPDWSELADALRADHAGALVILLTGPESDVAAHLTAWPSPSPIPLLRADDATLGALDLRAPLRANPVAFLFGPGGRLLRTVAGFPPIAHYLEDARAAAAGVPLPEHPAQGVLPEDNAP